MRLKMKTPSAALLSVMVAALSACSGSAQAPDTIPAETLKSDFDELYTRLQRAHYDLYARRDASEYDEKFNEMKRQIRKPMTRAKAEILFQKFMAYGNIAHANIDFPAGIWETFRSDGGKAFPLFVRFIGDDMMIADDMSGQPASLRGERIVSINGVSAEDVEDRLSAHLSADNAYLARTMLEFRFARLFWLEFGAPEEFALELENARGDRRTVVVPARARDDLKRVGGGDLFELDWDERRYEVMDSVGYLRPGPFYNNAPDAADMWDNAAFTAFIDEAFEAFESAGVPAVLIDLRANPGGDNSFSDHMVAWFADERFRFASHFYVRVSDETTASNARRLTGDDDGSISTRFDREFRQANTGDVIDFDLGDAAPRKEGTYPGDVYILIDRHSYSNTVTVAALAQDYGFATILGEETSDLATTYGAMEQFTLSRSGIIVNYPKAHIVRPGGGTEARGVIPDVAIASPLASAEDEMLEQAIDVIQADIGER